MSELYELTKNYFVFLQRYGYLCSYRDDEKSVSLVGKNNRIDIDFSIVGYELTCQFIDDDKDTFSLQDALDYMDIKDVKGIYQLSRKEEIEKGIIYLANVIKRLFDRIDVSDKLNFRKIAQYRLDIHKELLESYYFKMDIKKAEEWWRKGEYSKAQELYEKHINSLSKAQIKKLEYCIKKV